MLAGGLLPGSVTLVAGEPGVGKSTLLLQASARVAASGATVLLVSAEESAAHVRTRAERFGAIPDRLLILTSGDLDEVEQAVVAIEPQLVVVDSVQTVADPDVTGLPGSVAQVRAAADRLLCLAKHAGVAIVAVGQVTKEGGPAGPRALEHLVDTVLLFEGDRHHSLRFLRAVKHRFGPTDEIGIFELCQVGLRSVEDPGGLLLGDRRAEVPGSAVLGLLQGRRALLVELQALVCPGEGRRSTMGLGSARLAQLLAVLDRRTGLPFGRADVFVSVAGGFRADEPAVDLPLALALVSSATDRACAPDMAAFGEVGLAGEIRLVPGADRRLSEAARLGITNALVPSGTPDGPPGVRLHRVASLTEALRVNWRATGDSSSGAVCPTPLVPRGPTRPALPGLPGGTMPLWSTTAASL